MPLLRWTNLLLSATLLLQAPLLHARLLRIETIKSEPFGYDDARGKGGMMYEIGNLIASAAGMPYQNNVVPYARTVVSLRNGTADMVLRFGNEELTTVAHQVTPVLALPTMIFSRAASHILRFEDLQGATLATARSRRPSPIARKPIGVRRWGWIPINCRPWLAWPSSNSPVPITWKHVHSPSAGWP